MQTAPATSNDSKHKVSQGSDYAQHVGKRCLVNAATFRNLNGTILQYLDYGKKYLVQLDTQYRNPKTNRMTNLCRINCTQAWV